MIPRIPSAIGFMKKQPAASDNGEIREMIQARSSPGFHSARIMKKKHSQTVSRHSHNMFLKGIKDNGLDQCATAYTVGTPKKSPKRKHKKVKKTMKLVRPMTTTVKTINRKVVASNSNKYLLEASTKGATTDGVSMSNSLMHSGTSPVFITRKNHNVMPMANSTGSSFYPKTQPRNNLFKQTTM